MYSKGLPGTEAQNQMDLPSQSTADGHRLPHRGLPPRKRTASFTLPGVSSPQEERAEWHMPVSLTQTHLSRKKPEVVLTCPPRGRKHQKWGRSDLPLHFLPTLPVPTRPSTLSSGPLFVTWSTLVAHAPLKCMIFKGQNGLLDLHSSSEHSCVTLYKLLYLCQLQCPFL